jgi:hypothetical protein
MPPAAFEPTISAGERPQTYAIDRAANGTGYFNHINYSNYYKNRLDTTTRISCKNWDLSY